MERALDGARSQGRDVTLGGIRQSSDYTPDLLLDAWRDYRLGRVPRFGRPGDPGLQGSG